MLNITNYQRIVYQIYSESPVRMAIIKRPTDNKCSRGCGKREPSHTVGGIVNWYNHYGEQYGGSLKTKNRATIRPYNPTPRHISSVQSLSRLSATP